MAVEEQLGEPPHCVAESVAEDAVSCKEQVSASHASSRDAASEEFGELDDLEAVDMTAGVLMKNLPETEVNGRFVHHDGPLDIDNVPTILPADLTERSSHLSASATPDKAREIDIISQRIAVLHDHLQKSHVSFFLFFQNSAHDIVFLVGRPFFVICDMQLVVHILDRLFLWSNPGEFVKNATYTCCE